MTTYFVDAQGFYNNDDLIIKELCIMDANEMFNPLHLVFKSNVSWEVLSDKCRFTNKYLTKHYHKLSWYEGSATFCPTCILNNYDQDFEKAILYVLDENHGKKMKTLKKHFPKLRFVSYNKSISNLHKVPANITCGWREHGSRCAYKQCLSMYVDYCKSYL
jgi:hypothetical protein